MFFALLLAFGLGLLLATSMARQLVFRGGRIVALFTATAFATTVTVLLTGAPALGPFLAALVGAAGGTLLAPRN